MWKHLRNWMFGMGLSAVLGLAGTLHADSRDDLSRVKSDYDSVKSHYDNAKSKLDSYLDESVQLRQMDKDQLDELITQICKLDMKRDDDEASRLATELKDKIVDRVKTNYEHTVDDWTRVSEDIKRLDEEAKSVRSRAKELESKDEVKSNAESLGKDIDSTQEAIQKLVKRVNADKATLDRVKDGVMRGANNPMIRARMEYGKDMHKKLQDSFSCDERETVLASGRPDCVKFVSKDCQVIEFKPDTYSDSAAENEAGKYLNDVRKKFNSDDRAKTCNWNSEGPIFRPVGKTYPACRVP